MTTPDNSNPFKAGSGVNPPYLAGRRDEIRVIEKTLDEIKGKSGQMSRSPNPIVAFVGPRGVGKTVLLRRAIKEAVRREIHTSRLNSKILSGSLEDLIDHIFQKGILKKGLSRLKSFGFHILTVGLTFGVKDPKKLLWPVFTDFLSKKPLLLVLDEAHGCEPESLKLLFDVVQECMSEDMPIALIIAGTPVLPPYLRTCNVTFMERSEFLRFNTLSTDEAREALEKPAKDGGRPMDADALEMLLDWADNYPFFVQLAGVHAWDASIERGGDVITNEDARKGLSEADIKRVVFYKERFAELRKRKLVKYAAQSVRLIGGSKGEGITAYTLQERLMEMNEDMDDDGSLKTVDALLEVGFLWEEGDQLTPGIPSMFDYIERNVGGA